jgi:antitoxin ParD1/3/4
LLFLIFWERPLMNVSLTPELEKFVKKEVGTGLYQTANEVVRAALRRLQTDQHLERVVFPKNQEALEKRLLEGIERFKRGEYVDGEEVFRKLYKRIEKAKRGRA